MAQREFEQRQGALNNFNVFDISFQEKDGVWEIRHEWYYAILLFYSWHYTWNGESKVCLKSFHWPPTCNKDCELKTVKWRPKMIHSEMYCHKIFLLAIMKERDLIYNLK